MKTTTNSEVNDPGAETKTDEMKPNLAVQQSLRRRATIRSMLGSNRNLQFQSRIDDYLVKVTHQALAPSSNQKSCKKSPLIKPSMNGKITLTIKDDGKVDVQSSNSVSSSDSQSLESK